MKSLALVVLLACLCFLTSANAEETLKSQKDKLNYAIGVEISRNYKNQGLEMDLDLVMKGLKDGIGGKELLISEKELRKILTSYQSEVRLKQVGAKRIRAEKELPPPAPPKTGGEQSRQP